MRVATARLHHAPGRFLPRRLRSAQAAAICYRLDAGQPFFLLVRTRGGRWTFPKGGLEPGLTSAEAAAREAREEAGVHGRLHRRPVARYWHRKRVSPAGDAEFLVNAYLLRVVREDAPLETGRQPTWYTPEKSKKRLREGRSAEHAAEMARAIDAALRRIYRRPRARGVAH